MPLEGHWERQNTPLRGVGRRELKVLAAAVAVLAAAAALVLVLALRHHQSPARAGCVDITVPSTTGGASAHACGRAAQRLCHTTLARDPSDASAQAACRRAGLP
jgi:hypothetical protein